MLMAKSFANPYVHIYNNIICLFVSLTCINLAEKLSGLKLWFLPAECCILSCYRFSNKVTKLIWSKFPLNPDHWTGGQTRTTKALSAHESMLFNNPDHWTGGQTRTMKALSAHESVLFNIKHGICAVLAY